MRPLALACRPQALRSPPSPAPTTLRPRLLRLSSAGGSFRDPFHDLPPLCRSRRPRAPPGSPSPRRMVPPLPLLPPLRHRPLRLDPLLLSLRLPATPLRRRPPYRSAGPPAWQLAASLTSPTVGLLMSPPPCSGWRKSNSVPGLPLPPAPSWVTLWPITAMRGSSSQMLMVSGCPRRTAPWYFRRRGAYPCWRRSAPPRCQSLVSCPGAAPGLPHCVGGALRPLGSRSLPHHAPGRARLPYLGTSRASALGTPYGWGRAARGGRRAPLSVGGTPRTCAVSGHALLL